ncbi:MAG: hypothetical protein GX640_19685 [Fibrobacter sp.]|nr:hypothetical protein [Fibrobacter sp.]
MIFKLISFPFWILSKIVKLGGSSLKLFLTLIFDLLQFLVSHLIGAIFGAIVGLIFGKKHVGIRLFNHKRKHHRKLLHSHT